MNAYRKESQHDTAVQEASRRWWSVNPMTYDWARSISAEPATPEWFAEIDSRFFEASHPYLTESRPFDRIMPDDLRGKRVLEIGCGMGLHTSQLVRRGGDVTAVDLTKFAVGVTSDRLRQENLSARVVQLDAEELPFVDDEFDFVWSWGVIHHSLRTTKIVREIARVLRPEGETRVMVYNRQGIIARYTLARHYLLGLKFRSHTPDEILWRHTDGFMARYYHPEQVEDLFHAFFSRVEVAVLGQEVDVVPLPQPLRRLVAKRLSAERKRKDVASRGGFIFAIASAPN